MTQKERLYDKFGELLYVIAHADGIIDRAEKDALLDLLKEHEWAKEIKWSFDYASDNNWDVEKTYQSVIFFCHEYGPAPEYTEFISSMKTIADAVKSTNDSEDKYINSFSKDLIERFQKDLDELKANSRLK